MVQFDYILYFVVDDVFVSLFFDTVEISILEERRQIHRTLYGFNFLLYRNTQKSTFMLPNLTKNGIIRLQVQSTYLHHFISYILDLPINRHIRFTTIKTF